VRIAVFVKGTIFHAQYGGLETQNQALCEGLAEKGHQIHIFSPKKELLFAHKSINSIEYHFIESKFKMGMIFGFFGFLDKNNWVNRSYEEFFKINSKDKFDVVISQSTAGIGIIKRKSNHDFKSLMVAHGSILSEYKTYLKEFNLAKPAKYMLLVKNTAFALKNFFTRQRECVLNANHVVTVSNYVKKALVEETFAPEKKFTVIHNGIQKPEVDVSTKNYSNSLFFAGRLEKSKGVHIMLKALKSIFELYPDTKVIIAGKGPEEENLKKLANELGLFQKVQFVGWVQKDELAKIYQDSSILVLPTIRVEGFPMSLVEASAYGLVLIASDIGGNSDAVLNDKTGYLTIPGDASDLSAKITKVLENPTFARTLGNESRKHFEENFTRDIMISKYISVLENL
jgi:glycosyltransferase involved in cell wall biosynthesis